MLKHLFPSILLNLFLTFLSSYHIFFTIIGHPSYSTELQPLNTSTWWFGNTWGGGPGENPQFFQMAVEDFVVVNNLIFTICHWDERGSESAIYSTNGEYVRRLPGWHSWGRRGGSAITSDGRYVYISMGHDPNDGGGENYSAVARYTLDGEPAPFPGAIGDPKCHLKINSNHQHKPTGLAVIGNQLLVSDPATDQIMVFSLDQLKLQYTFTYPSPGRILADPFRPDNIWIINKKSKEIVQLSLQGKELGPKLKDIKEPVAFCFDRVNRHLLVADGAIDRQSIYRYEYGSWKRLAHLDFGSPVYQGKNPGKIEPGKFYRITGIQTDDQANLYVSAWDCGAKLYKFNTQRQLVWDLAGLEFVSCADADPGDDTSVYSCGRRYYIDYSGSPGKNWKEIAITLDPIRYPLDPRLQVAYWQAIRMFRIKNQKLMMGKTQMGSAIYFWRFQGEIAVPAAMIYPAPPRKEDKYPPYRPIGSAFIWMDLNGDGTMQEKEYKTIPPAAIFGHSTTVDEELNLWVNVESWDAGKAKIMKIPFQGLTFQGVPTWNDQVRSIFPVPVVGKMQKLSKLYYHTQTDCMILGCWTEDHPYPGGGWEQMSVGPVVICLGAWSSKTPTLLWRTVVKREKALNQVIKAWSFEDSYFFITYTYPNQQAVVDVYRLDNGNYIGSFLPTKEIGSVTGWIDMNDAIQSHKRKDGTYIVFLEEDWMAKGIYFKWKP